MKLRNAIPFVIFSLPIATLASGGGSQAPGGATSARFSRTHDPARVVLFVQSERPGAAVRDTMTLYGDGRVALSRYQEGTVERREMRLPASEVDALVRQVVDDGLADFDPVTIRARQIEAHGNFHPKSSSGPLVKVLISLESLQRGEGPAAPVEKTIDFMSPQLSAERFPEIREYAGLVRLLDLLQGLFVRAEVATR
jgi:hypothetical protein